MDKRFERDYQKLAEGLSGWLAGYVRGAGFTKVVIGISGGVDSAVSAALAVRGLGAENVHGLLLPHEQSDPASESDGRLVCEQLGISCERVEITPYCAPLLEEVPADEYLRQGNIKARIRMIVLFDHSNSLPALVLGTGNKTEILFGYSTLHGDDACALNPLAHLYKTEVWELARELGLPEAVIEKSPSADLWAGQTDEDELGISYREADKVLYDMVKLRLGEEELITNGHEPARVRHLFDLVRKNAFKQRLPAIPPKG